MSPEERRATGELLLPIKKTCTLIIVEHDLDFIKDICDNLTVLDQGKIIDTGTVEEIKLSKKVFWSFFFIKIISGGIYYSCLKKLPY